VPRDLRADLGQRFIVRRLYGPGPDTSRLGVARMTGSGPCGVRVLGPLFAPFRAQRTVIPIPAFQPEAGRTPSTVSSF